MGCVFCEEEILDNEYFQSENFRVIYNIAPILPGHSLIIPKRHTNSLLDLSDAEAAELMLLSRQVVKKLQNYFSATGFDYTIQEGEEAGQTVFHLHLHLIPRKLNDLTKNSDWYLEMKSKEHEFKESRKLLNPTEIRRIVDQLRIYFRDIAQN